MEQSEPDFPPYRLILVIGPTFKAACDYITHGLGYAQYAFKTGIWRVTDTFDHRDVFLYAYDPTCGDYSRYDSVIRLYRVGSDGRAPTELRPLPGARQTKFVLYR